MTILRYYDWFTSEDWLFFKQIFSHLILLIIILTRPKKKETVAVFVIWLVLVPTGRNIVFTQYTMFFIFVAWLEKKLATNFFQQQRVLQKALNEKESDASSSSYHGGIDDDDDREGGGGEREIKAVHQKLVIGPVAQDFEGVSDLETLKTLEDPEVFVACSASLNHSTGILLDSDCPKNDEVIADYDPNKESYYFYFRVGSSVWDSIDFVTRFYRNVRHWLGFKNLPPCRYRILFGHSDNAVMQSFGKGSLVAVSQKYDYCDKKQTTTFVKKRRSVKMTDLVYNEGQKFNIISTTRLLMDGWTLGHDTFGVWFEKDGVRLTFYHCDGLSMNVFATRVCRFARQPSELDEQITP